MFFVLNNMRSMFAVNGILYEGISDFFTWAIIEKTR